MGLIGRYVLKQTLAAFLLCLGALGGIVWITQALREFDLLTAKGQTLILFAKFTLLILPTLVMVIGPVALFIAVVFTLNRLNRDSELVIVNASGASPWRIMRPFIIMTGVITLFLYSMSLHFIPESYREMRHIITQVRADLLTSIIQPGRFVQIEANLTFHIRNRLPDGTLDGLMMHDTRTQTEEITYIARNGAVTENENGTFLVMQDGVIQRKSTEQGQTIVAFDRYVFDLSQFSQANPNIHYKAREMLTPELIWPDLESQNVQWERDRMRAELVDRFASPLYAFAFVFIALSILGHARTNRQQKFFAIILASVLVAIVRGLGFVTINLTMATNAAIPFAFILPVGTTLFFAWVALGRGEVLSKMMDRFDQITQIPIDFFRKIFVRKSHQKVKAK